jgi:uncharacterized protein (UPF0248 family)
MIDVAIIMSLTIDETSLDSESKNCHPPQRPHIAQNSREYISEIGWDSRRDEPSYVIVAIDKGENTEASRILLHVPTYSELLLAAPVHRLPPYRLLNGCWLFSDFMPRNYVHFIQNNSPCWSFR